MQEVRKLINISKKVIKMAMDHCSQTTRVDVCIGSQLLMKCCFQIVWVFTVANIDSSLRL